MSDRPMNAIVRDFRGAVALNNMGVSLLERRAFRDAANVLRDGLTLMKVLVEQRGRESNPVGPGAVDDMIQRGNQLLAATSSDSADTYPAHSVTLDIVPRDETDAFETGSILRTAKTSILISPIRIEHTSHPHYHDGGGGVKNHEYDYEMSVIMLNFALAHLCLHMVTKARGTAKKMLEASMKAIVAIKVALSSYWSHSMDPQERSRMMFLSCIVLHTSAQVLFIKRKRDEAKAEAMKLSVLIEALSDFNNRCSHGQQTPPLAAAA